MPTSRLANPRYLRGQRGVRQKGFQATTEPNDAGRSRARFDVVVVWRFDRFARSVSHLRRALESFNALGIQFVSLSEQVDTSTPTGKMVFAVLGAVAELERNLIAERVRAGLRHAKAKGKTLGRPRKQVDPAKVVALRQSGLSRRLIARQVGLSWTSPSSIAPLLGVPTCAFLSRTKRDRSFSC